ncbi:MAG: glutamine-hydrolyzing carbamoyl-phosphate synthase small subunit [Candidatus Woesearchaeota archaeon]|jgi:carbamoyl-phosphate synthase small subunit|nr:glutamine-hydrolyzing carbamoyl-phosphate synthase small subunit [Candidatus Woesearchaeota archaeon]MDP7457227.1 glutamine-hydrolyzing carbamoyl-phosphate synthase small subunit [Candidatus Woesearchaeota archaeon]|tara:strand:- start:543 stop:1610 length:1068 start_codon:yes stop_codon:yes gene_type:complete
MGKNIKLILQDGSVFQGKSFGAEKSISGEVVFNTGMVGYPETMTDPSYKGQILCLTYPLIGNYGVPDDSMEDNMLKNFESSKIQIQGLLIDNLSVEYSHWNAKKSLDEWMKEHNIPGIYGIDTRALTKRLREKGTIIGKIVNGNEISYYDPNTVNLVDEVSVKEPVTYKRGPKKVVVIDCGIKNNIIRSFLKRDITVIRVPWDYDIFANNLEFDGLFISNGPGDPKMCKETVETIKKAFEKEIPTFGICLGNQLLALAAGADTYKLKYGHRSQNQPCLELGTKRCYITSQNHGFAVKEDSIPKEWEAWFVNINDQTNEGMKHKTKPFFSCQFHPEATPGPVDTAHLFDRFISLLK